MQHEDLTAVDLLYPKRQDPQELDDRGKEQLPDPSSKESTEGYEARGETYSVKHSGKQQFWYYKDMEPEKSVASSAKLMAAADAWDLSGACSSSALTITARTSRERRAFRT